MSTKLDPIVSEFETEEQAASYEIWFRAKVKASLDNPRPSIPHDEVMAKVEAIITEAKARRKRDLDEYNGLSETTYLLESPANAKLLRESIEQLRSGKTVNHELLIDDHPKLEK